MRKFTKFFMLLFALVGATVGNAQSLAENPTPISELTSGFYVIKNVNSRQPLNYIYCANTVNGALKHTATVPSEGVTDPATIDKYLWYVDVKNHRRERDRNYFLRNPSRLLAYGTMG